MRLLEVFCDVDDFMLKFVPTGKPAKCQRASYEIVRASSVPASHDDFDPPSSIALSDVRSLWQGTCAGASDQRISSSGEVSALCGDFPHAAGGVLVICVIRLTRST